MHKAFPDKLLMARNASYKSCQAAWLGFHDDMIPEDTFGTHDWEFLPSLKAAKCADNWKVAPTGGEMVPGQAHRYLGKEWDLLLRAVREAHFSWIGPYCPALERSLSPLELERVNELIRTLGYDFRLKVATVPPQTASGAHVALRIEGVNQGVAPFYFPWKVRFALIDSQNRIASAWNAGADVRMWLPGPFVVEWSGPIVIPPGSYRLGLGIVDPATDSPAVRFANALDTVAGFTVVASMNVVKPLTN
jgi:hypothetical protein